MDPVIRNWVESERGVSWELIWETRNPDRHSECAPPTVNQAPDCPQIIDPPTPPLQPDWTEFQLLPGQMLIPVGPMWVWVQQPIVLGILIPWDPLLSNSRLRAPQLQTTTLVRLTGHQDERE